MVHPEVCYSFVWRGWEGAAGDSCVCSSKCFCKLLHWFLFLKEKKCMQRAILYIKLSGRGEGSCSLYRCSSHKIRCNFTVPYSPQEHSLKMSVHAYSPFAYILAQATVSFEQLVLKKYSCWFGLTKGKNIVTNICKNICSFSAFFHWHFPPGSVTAQSSKSVCHWASGERKQTLCSVDQKTPIDFDASLAVCLILSLESQPHLTLLATRAKQSQTSPPRSWGTSAAFGFPSPGLFCWHWSTKGWNCLWRPGTWGVLQVGAAAVQCPKLQESSASSHPQQRAAQLPEQHRELESSGWGWLQGFSPVRCAAGRIFS